MRDGHNAAIMNHTCLVHDPALDKRTDICWTDVGVSRSPESGDRTTTQGDGSRLSTLEEVLLAADTADIQSHGGRRWRP
jgi:hypothetical protein